MCLLIYINITIITVVCYIILVSRYPLDVFNGAMLYIHFFCDINKNGKKMQQLLQMTVVIVLDAVTEWSLDYHYHYYRQHVKLSGPLLIHVYIS